MEKSVLRSGVHSSVMSRIGICILDFLPWMGFPFFSFFFVVGEPFGRALTSGIATAEDLVKHRSPALLGAFSLVWRNYA